MSFNRRENIFEFGKETILLFFNIGRHPVLIVNRKNLLSEKHNDVWIFFCIWWVKKTQSDVEKN